jgi:ankyrin repeat protein
MDIDKEVIREFVIAGHGDLARVKEMLAEEPGLLNLTHQWGEDDFETALGAAAHVGNEDIANYLLSEGAPLDICTAAMLGRRTDVEYFIRQDPHAIHATGAHRIPLLTHAAFSDDLELIQWLVELGASAGATAALRYAVLRGNYELVQWLLENTNPDVAEKDFQGKNALTIATERNDESLVQLLRAHGAAD